MPLTDYQKNWIIQQSGYDPKDYDVDEATQTIFPKNNQQPVSSPTIYQPKLEPGYRPVEPASSAASAFVKSAAESAPSSVAGGLGAAGGLAVLGSLGLDMTGIGAVAGIPLMALAAYGAAKGTRAIQKQVEPEQWQQEVAQAQQEHPIASLAGGLSTIPLGGFGPNSIRNLGSAAGAIPKLVSGMSLTPAEAANVMNVGIGTALPPIQDIVESQAEGRGMPSVGSLLGNAALGTVFSKPWALGRAIGFHDVNVPDELFTPELLKRAKVSKGENTEPALKSGLENLPVRYTKPESELTKEEDTRLALEQGIPLSGSLEGAWKRGRAMAKYKTNPEDMSGDEARAAAEGMGEITRYRKLANDAKENLKSAGVDLPSDLFPENEFSKAIRDVEQRTPTGKAALRKKGEEESLSPDIQEAINKGDVKLQEQSAITTEGEQRTKKLLEEQGYTGNLTPEWFAVSQALAKKRGVDLKTNEKLESTGRATIPSDRQAVESALAEINPAKAGADTSTHEILHIFANDLRNSNRSQDVNFLKRYDSLTEQLPDYQRWAKERANAGKNSSVEEYQMTNGGVETINRALSTEGQFQKWKNDFSGYLKTRWSKHATNKDFQRIMNYKLLNDPAYYKILGIKPPNYLNGGVVSRNQEESNFSNEKERSIKPAFKYSDGTIEEGNVGEIHAQIGKTAFNGNARVHPTTGEPTKDYTSGFITNKGKYVTRDEAYALGAGHDANEIRLNRIKNQDDSNLPLNRLPKDKQETPIKDETGKVNELYKKGDIDLETAGKLLLGDSRNQDESNLVPPGHPSIGKTIKEAFTKTDDATLTPEHADELHAALRDQVDWPTESTIPDLLKSKDFDNLDPDHWKQLQKVYDNEVSQYGEKETPVKPVETPKKEIEVPRAIPEAALERAKSTTEEVKQSNPRTKKELNYTPGEKVTNMGGEKPPKMEESKLVREKAYTPEENKESLLSSKMAWEAIDKTTDPQGTMDSLRNQYNYALEKERSYRRIGEVDSADRMADLRTATLMRMHYLGEKKGIEVPKDLEMHYQNESNLRNEMPADKAARELKYGNLNYSEHVIPLINEAIESIKNKWDKSFSFYDIAQALEHEEGHKWLRKAIGDLDANHLIDTFNKVRVNQKIENTLSRADNPMEWNQDTSNLKEPNLHNRVKEFGKGEESHPLNYYTPKGFTAQLDVIRKTRGKEGKAFADEYERYAPLKDELSGKYYGPVYRGLKGLSKADKTKVENTLLMERRDRQEYRNLLNDKQQKAYDAIRGALRQKQEDQIAAGQMVTDYKKDGTKYLRPAQIDPFYFPHRISAKVAEQLAENTPSAQRLKEDFLSYQKEHGISDKIAEQKLQAIESAYHAGKPNLTRFGAVREAEGIGLPDSWMKNDLEGNLSSYFNRVAADRAFHDTFESNPDVLKSAFGREFDSKGNPIETEYSNISGDKNVKAVAERITGEPFDKDESFLKSLNRVATSLMLGPLTNVHIAASSVANSLQYLKPVEAIPALAKAITNVTDGYAKAVSHGKIKPSTTSIGDIIDHNNTSIEKLRALANTIGKINGRDATNNFTNAFLQNIGEWVIKSKSIAANAGDKSAIDLMRRVDPDWQANKKYSPAEIESLASTFGGIIHGSHDARTLPGWMLKDTAIQPFFSLASWNIAQTNAWMRHVLTPAKHGNFTPLIMSLFGSALGGYIIKEGREALADKKSPIPSLQEIVDSSRGVEGNLPLLAYNGVAMSSYVGFAGILSVAAKAAFDLAYKNIPQAATFPLDEAIGNSAHRISQSVSALMNDNTAHLWNVGPRLAIDLAKENIQLARLALSWSSNSKELSENIPGMEQERYSKLLNQKTQDLRRFKMVEGMPYDEQSISESNPYLGQGIKRFKRTEDIGEAVEQLPELISNAFEKAQGNPDVLKNELHKIKANTYETMPDPDRMPMSFIRYLNFLQQTQGVDAASDRLIDYVRHKEYNKLKSEMVPSI